MHRPDFDIEGEIIWTQIEMFGEKSILVGAFYRPPSSDLAYLSTLRESLSKITKSQHSNVWLAGDLNLGDIIWSNQSVKLGAPKANISKELINIAADFGFEQVIDKPTRGERILDLFFTTNPTLVTKSTVVPGISDHDGIASIVLNTSVKRSNQPPRKIYLYQRANCEDWKADAQKISDDFASRDLSVTDAENLWNELKDRVLASEEKHVPSKIVRGKKTSPWITSQIKRHQRKKQRAYNRAVKSNTPEEWERFREIRKSVKKETRKSYRKFIHDKCAESTKQLYSFIKALKNDNTSISALKDPELGTLITDSQQKAEILSKQFQSQFPKENLEDLPIEPESKIPSMPDFIIHEAGVIKLLAELNSNKATGPDGNFSQISQNYSRRDRLGSQNNFSTFIRYRCSTNRLVDFKHNSHF
ncbi:uncharacterized protein [Apostichopus japonicus]|uniref:uncharacterized protein isoform X1 n=1 Tax=Stichopus japonicus TaxID=307972 RepID=UPI003AB6498F